MADQEPSQSGGGVAAAVIAFLALSAAQAQEGFSDAEATNVIKNGTTRQSFTLEETLELGATDAVDPSAGDVVAQVAELCGGRRRSSPGQFIART